MRSFRGCCPADWHRGRARWVSPSLKRDEGLQPEGCPLRPVACRSLALQLRRQEPALAVVILDRRADGEPAGTRIGHCRAVHLVIGELLVPLAAGPDGPAVAQSPAGGGIEDEIVPGGVAGVLGGAVV